MLLMLPPALLQYCPPFLSTTEHLPLPFLISPLYFLYPTIHSHPLLPFRPLLFSWFLRVLQVVYSHVQIWNQKPHMEENIRYFFFWVQVISHNAIFSNSLHIPANFIISLVFKDKQYSIVKMIHIFISHASFEDIQIVSIFWLF